MSNQAPKFHVGRLLNTDRKCVVVFESLPGKEDHALIVDTDALPDRLHDALMDVVESREGQQEKKLGNVLARRLLPDMGIDILNALHQRQALITMPISNVIMYPLPNEPVALQKIVDFRRKQEGLTPLQAPVQEQRYETLQAEHLARGQEDNIGAARSLLIDADMLENEARLKREKAYSLAPSLRPNANPHVQKAEAPVALTTEQKLQAHIARLEAQLNADLPDSEDDYYAEDSYYGDEEVATESVAEPAKKPNRRGINGGKRGRPTKATLQGLG